ncbi:hypothetical protein [Arthrobacter sp. MYb213]|uniref:hypothetical protein n=1 Tax=Arthrobacter sp. MYb213 TaxID=1848595 RepID=UPI000CFAFA7F|nr:hypothetical protein [Arthrobacter sp. MYb213]PRB71157.1 hypothetical protein CQ011_04385 [Arthrobacter sp. MYb213]
MRWESFFEDLEAQAEAQHAAQLRDEVAEGIRVERATERMHNRLLEMQSSTVDVKLTGGVELNARLGPVAAEYFCLESDGTRWLVRWLALRSLGMPSMKLNPGGRFSPVKFAAVVRGVLRDRQRVVIYDVSGQLVAEGTLSQVGADFLIIAIHPRDEYARDRSITGYQLLPLETIGWLQVAGPT